MTPGRLRVLAAIAWLAMVASPSVANHDAGCVPERVDPSRYQIVDTVDGRRFYVMTDLSVAWPHLPGYWIFEEVNGLEAPDGSLQRGSIGFGYCYLPDPLPCLMEPHLEHMEQHCGHGPDDVLV